MTTVKVTRDVRNLLKNYREGKESVDATVNRLLDLVEEDMGSCNGVYKDTVNINLSKDTMERVKGLRVYKYESYNDILVRVLSLLDDE